MKKILITGGTGFIGAHLVQNLKNNNKIYLIVRKKIKSSDKNVKKIFFRNYYDLNLKLKKIRADIIIHCATHYVKNHNYNDVEKIISSNILFGNILLENLKKMHAKKFINFTTVWENYNGKAGNALNLYSASKQSFKNIIKYYAVLNKNIKFYDLFISDTYGKNDKRTKLVNVIKKKISTKKKLLLISKKLSINLTNIQDIISAVNIILDKKIKPGSYLLKNNKNYFLGDIIKQISLQKKLKIKWMLKKKIIKKFYSIKKLPMWNPRFSSKKKLIQFIIND